MPHTPPDTNHDQYTPNLPVCPHCGECTAKPCTTDYQVDMCDNFSTYLSSALRTSDIQLNIPPDED